MMHPICEGNLTLVAVTQALCIAERAGQLARALNARVPAVWPPPHVDGVTAVFEAILEESPHLVGFLGWYWIATTPDGVAHLVGFGGFKGAPDDEGWLEIGYAVSDDHKGQGYATRAVGALLTWAHAHDHVFGVSAQVRPANMASRKVLKRNGFTYAETIYNREEGHTELLFLRSFLSA